MYDMPTVRVKTDVNRVKTHRGGHRGPHDLAADAPASRGACPSQDRCGSLC